MQARIIQYSKSANQGAPKEDLGWVLEFEPQIGTITKDKLMGWVSCSDMQQEIKLKFPTLLAAEEFAKTNNINYEIQPANRKKLIKKSYADNFK